MFHRSSPGPVPIPLSEPPSHSKRRGPAAIYISPSSEGKHTHKHMKTLSLLLGCPWAPPQLSVVQTSQGFFLMELPKKQSYLSLSAFTFHLKTHTHTYLCLVSAVSDGSKSQGTAQTHYMRPRQNCPRSVDQILTPICSAEPHHKTQLKSHVLALITVFCAYCVELYNVDLTWESGDLQDLLCHARMLFHFED